MDQTKEERKTITVIVNKEPVAFSDRKVTGLHIKRRAIEQGVKIKEDFNLFIIREHEEPRQVGDDQEVELHEDERFRAVTPDEKS